MTALALQTDHHLPPPGGVGYVRPNANLHETADAAEVLFLRQLPSLKIYTEILLESDGIKARVVERKNGGLIEKIIIGYYDGGSWIHRRWAFSPLRSGYVPTIDGSSLDSWVSTWRRDHEVAGFYGLITGTRYCALKSGDEFGYATTSDDNGRDYILIPANGQDSFTGYVPARELLKSLKNGYLTDPDGFKLIYDNSGALHLACKTVDYEKHGFQLHNRVWWPVKKGAYEEHAEEIEIEVAKIEGNVQTFLTPPPVYAPQLMAPVPLNVPPPAADEDLDIGIDYLEPVENYNDLELIEKARAETVLLIFRQAINEHPGLDDQQRAAFIDSVSLRIRQMAMRRGFSKETGDITVRPHTIESPPDQSCTKTAFIGTSAGLGGALATLFPLPALAIATTVGGTVLATKAAFDDKCFLNKFFSWVGI